MTSDEAVLTWAKWYGPKDSTVSHLIELGLTNERGALDSMQDEIYDGETLHWTPDIHEAYAVLRRKHPKEG